MAPTAFNHIVKKYDHLTKSEKKLADYIFQHQNDVEYMSIVSLADICNVAEATISRFCRKLDYNGYNEFKLALAKENSLQREGDYSPNLDDTDDPVISRMQQLFHYDMASLQDTMSLIDSPTITQAVEYLNQAEHVYCIGQGGSMVMAMEAWARFAVVTQKFVWIPDSHMQAMTASLSGEKDVIILFSYSGATKDSLDLLRVAREHHTKIILITHFRNSPAAVYADVILLCGSKEGPLQTGSIAAKLGQLFLIDILYNEYCAINMEETTQNRDTTSLAIATKLL